MFNPQPLSDLTSAAPPVADDSAEQHWYAVYTRARHEKVVAALLRQKAVATFLPFLSQEHRWSDRRKVVEVPLFPGYTFVRIAATPGARLRVLQTAGVVSLVGNGHIGVPIPDKQIEDIQTVLAHRVPCAIFPLLRVGQRIRVRGGCLDGIEGLLVRFKGERSLVISVQAVLQSIAISLKGYDVEILSPPSDYGRKH